VVGGGNRRREDRRGGGAQRSRGGEPRRDREATDGERCRAGEHRTASINRPSTQSINSTAPHLSIGLVLGRRTLPWTGTQSS
jgi:hypothetical protein